ncbi:hypothetical protein PMAYCL1PPCAC_30632, partial [Pristionchus mayeri]
MCVFFIVGGPSLSKGTQCEKIVVKYGLSHLSSGDLHRAKRDLPKPTGVELTKIMEAPLTVVLDLIKEAILKEVAKGSNGFLIDGYPQGYQFETEIIPAKLAVYFEVSEETLVTRLLKCAETSGRDDDNIDATKKRLKTFSEATAPVVAQYEKKGKLDKIPVATRNNGPRRHSVATTTS